MANSRRVLIALVVLTGLTFVVYQYYFKNKEVAPAPKDKPLALQTSNDAFTQSLNVVVEEYLTMKDALVKDDTATAKLAANAFSQKLESIAWSQLKADSILITLAQSLQKDIQTSCSKLTAATDIATMRRHFQGTSNMLFDLLRSVKFKGGKLYQQYCPMAFDNAGAYWMSAEMEILNPYFGDEMLHCGEIKDSISFEN